MSDTLFARCRARFALGDERIYLLGHSLGPASHASIAAVERCAREAWARDLAASWNNGWMQASARVGAKIASRIGADPHEVHVTDCVTVNLYKLAGAARMASARAGFVIEDGGFPSDSYALEGVLSAIGGYALMTPRDSLADAITDDTAAVIATEVDFRTGARLDLKRLAAAATARSAYSLIDLSHSAGILDVDLDAAGVDLAVGCGYKYFNGGPGAPAFVYVAARHHGRLQTPLPGWMGHAEPFAFDPIFSPAADARAFATGTPPILSLAALEGALDAIADANPHDLAAQALELGDIFDAAVGDASTLGLERVTPAVRGAHLAYRFAHGFALKEALIARGVIGDFRTPDLLRFGFSPLYISADEARRAGEIVRAVLASQSWRDFLTQTTPQVT
jgi:kynureninase